MLFALHVLWQYHGRLSPSWPSLFFRFVLAPASPRLQDVAYLAEVHETYTRAISNPEKKKQKRICGVSRSRYHLTDRRWPVYAGRLRMPVNSYCRLQRSCFSSAVSTNSAMHLVPVSLKRVPFLRVGVGCDCGCVDRLLPLPAFLLPAGAFYRR